MMFFHILHHLDRARLMFSYERGTIPLFRLLGPITWQWCHGIVSTGFAMVDLAYVLFEVLSQSTLSGCTTFPPKIVLTIVHWSLDISMVFHPFAVGHGSLESARSVASYGEILLEHVIINSGPCWDGWYHWKKKKKSQSTVGNNSWNWVKRVTSLDGAYKVVVVCQVWDRSHL